MMIHAYSEFYLNDAKQNLAEFFDYAINVCRFDANLFSKLFVQSGYADKFERGNPAIVAGILRVSFTEIISMYSVYHEMDIEHFIEDIITLTHKI